MDELDTLMTETANEATINLDNLSTLELLKCINEQDKSVALAVEKEVSAIATAVDRISIRMKQGGRLIYVGCGTSGRLGVLDASECPVTFGVSEDTVVGLIAGGRKALFKSQEEIEDSFEASLDDLKAISIKAVDSVVGIAASGRTPYVLGAVRFAREIGCFTAGISCNPNSQLSNAVELAICPVVGPEVLAGSTRMKAGTAQKMILNMISTGVFVRLDKCYSNLMVDVQGSACHKLKLRARRILKQVSGCNDKIAEGLLLQSGYELKPAIVMAVNGVELDEASKILLLNGGNLRKSCPTLQHG